MVSDRGGGSRQQADDDVERPPLYSAVVSAVLFFSSLHFPLALFSAPVLFFLSSHHIFHKWSFLLMSHLSAFSKIWFGQGNERTREDKTEIEDKFTTSVLFI